MIFDLFDCIINVDKYSKFLQCCPIDSNNSFKYLFSPETFVSPSIFRSLRVFLLILMKSDKSNRYSLQSIFKYTDSIFGNEMVFKNLKLVLLNNDNLKIFN